MKRYFLFLIIVVFVFYSCSTGGTRVKKTEKPKEEKSAKAGAVDALFEGDGEEKPEEEDGKSPIEKLRELKEKNKRKEVSAGPVATATPRDLDDDIIAVIGGYTLTKDKYNIILDYMRERHDYKLTEEQKKEFINFIINKKLMAMEARNRGYAEKKEIKVKYEWDFDDIVSHEFYEKNVEEKSGVSLSQARNYYKKNKEDFVEIKARHILVKNKGLAKNLYKRILAGEDFGELAEKYSQDETTKGSGGLLGFFSKGNMVREFEDAAFALSRGEVSGPVKTVFGYHIIKAEDKRKISFTESKDKILKMIEEKKKQVVFDRMIENLKKKYNVIINKNITE